MGLGIFLQWGENIRERISQLFMKSDRKVFIVLNRLEYCSNDVMPCERMREFRKGEMRNNVNI
jgi:hypothetical protein